MRVTIAIDSFKGSLSSLEAGLADTIVGGDESNRRRGVWDRVKEWFLPSDKSQKEECPISDINILHLPENGPIATSIIALEEGQKSFKKSEIAKCEDPSLEGTTLSHNSLAYAEDLRNLRYRGL
jgi:hypothetical protein